MKQILDWLREKIDDHLNHCKQMEEQSRYFSEEIGYCSRADAYEIALELINEAEAKWELECCEWKYFKPSKSLYEKHEDFRTDEELSKWTFCPYCGKPIKIVEVE